MASLLMAKNKKTKKKIEPFALNIRKGPSSESLTILKSVGVDLSQNLLAKRAITPILVARFLCDVINNPINT